MWSKMEKAVQFRGEGNRILLQSTTKMESVFDIHEWLNRCSEINKEYDTADNLNVELGKLKWVSPAGITVLLSTLNYLDKYYYLKTGSPSYEITDRFDILGYLKRMNFLKLCPPDVKESF